MEAATGSPEGVLQYLPGPGSEVGLALVERAARMAPGQRQVKRVIAEMGGKNAIIIVGAAYDEALGRLCHAVESLVVGPPHDPATQVPPLIKTAARKKVQGYILGAKSYARIAAQATVPSVEGCYVPPTVVTGVPLDSPLAREEVFGPVLAIFRAASFEEALILASDSDYALTGGVFSRNPRNIERARSSFRVGNLYVNRRITGAQVGRPPFGGFARSGFGEKAGGPDYVRQFMQPRLITENTMRRGFAP